jgi:hypothetical protein
VNISAPTAPICRAEEQTMQQEAVYLIHIAGPLAESDVSWFDGLMIIQSSAAGTILLTPAVDQTGLHGILAILRDLAIPLQAVYQLAPVLHAKEAVCDR